MPCTMVYDLKPMHTMTRITVAINDEHFESLITPIRKLLSERSFKKIIDNDQLNS